jgi:hypothetical protein
MNRQKRAYVAGPMTGMPDLNFPAVHAAASSLREHGWDVVNPAEALDGDVTKPRAFYMRADINAILSVDAVFVLPNWQDSKGATLEVAIARELGLPVFDADTRESL